MDWTPVSYAYDGSFAGFLTCVFASYAHREEPMSFSTPEDGRISLWPERTVDTDEARAQRGYRSLAPRLGQEGRRLAVYGFLTCLEERELHLWRFIALGYERGGGVMRELTDPRLAVLRKADQHLCGEAQLLRGFVRFSDQGGVLVAEIEPKNRVLPLLRVPGIGVTSARRILVARRCAPLTFAGLKKLGVVLKRAQYFLTCGGKYLEGLRVSPDGVLRHLVAQERPCLLYTSDAADE